MVMDLNALFQNAIVTLVALGWKLAGAVALWFVGRWLISFAIRLVGQALDKQQGDVTLTRYAQTTLRIVLNIALIVALLGFFGVETTSFAALLAAGGVAIGVAWSGLLANFAAGVFLVFLRPFKVGDFVTAGGVTGTVDAIGLFGTVINTPDNVHTIVGNNKILETRFRIFRQTRTAASI
jgi:small conductance mechanosensitive channel